MMNNPKVTVIIPTRERCDVLEKSLKTITAQDYDNLEIIVSDNFSSDQTEQVVREANDARVTYINTGQRVGMSQNWEFALSFALSKGTDGWVTIVGDDDGLMPAALTRLSEIVQDTDVEAITSRFCTYIWPSVYEPAALIVPLTSGAEIRDSAEWLNKVMDGDAAYTELPMLYTGGWATLKTIEKIKGSRDKIYRSAIPDVYSGVAIASVVDRYMYLYEPLALGGSSKHSNGASFLKEKKGDNTASPSRTFLSEPNIAFHPEIPLYADGSYPPSIQALVFESYLQSDFLRPATDDDQRKRMRDRQMEVILEKGAVQRNNERTLEWLSDYARKHNVDIDDIRARSKRNRRPSVLSLIRSKLQIAIEYYIASGADFALRDVAEASIVASEIRRDRPGIMEVIKAKLYFVLERSWSSRFRRSI